MERLTANEGAFRLVAAFEDADDADGAVRALVRAGLGRASVHEERGAPVRRWTSRSPAADDTQTVAEVGLSAGTGAVIGGVIGAVAGFLLALLFAPDRGVFLAAGAVGGAVAGSILGMVAAGVSAADMVDQPDDDTAYESSDRRRRVEWLVVVEAPDEVTAERAASLLAGMGPLRVERYAPGGRRLSA